MNKAFRPMWRLSRTSMKRYLHGCLTLGKEKLCAELNYNYLKRDVCWKEDCVMTDISGSSVKLLYFPKHPDKKQTI